MTDYAKFNAHLRLLLIRRDSGLLAYYDAYAEAPLEVQEYHDRREGRARRRRRQHLPNPGNSEVIMRNRVKRAKSFGLEHDGLFNSPVNRG